MNAVTRTRCAKAIAKAAFTAINGERGSYLKLLDALGCYLGGWSEPLLAREVEEILARYDQRKKRKAGGR
jgi:hypothetical protein